ncbi:MAG: GNAT family N-acetyltransferase [Candidatus Omnitrophica bacterium]|nr:GNAT family N-acetyltransferase [Candidatus Omnitrophota bacterium]
MEILNASDSDIPELCRLLDILFSQEEEFAPNAEAQRKGLLKIMENPEIGHIMIARMDNKIVGMVNVLFTVSTALGERVAILEDMVILPETRGNGIGSKLLESAIQVAHINGCRRITLLTDQTNTSAQRFYLKHGFKLSTMVPFRLMLKE